jgi:PKD repeat protein
VIIAKPQAGLAPLKVSFNGRKSFSPNGKIVFYSWDFGDGDKSNKPNPTNTYWSTTYGVREFTATLTVKDNKGMVSSASIPIKVSNE